MTLAELRAEFAKAQDEVDFWEPYEDQVDAWDRRDELWKALEKRAEVEQPECPGCGGRRWGQAPGDPVTCVQCGRAVGSDLEREVHDAWRQIREGADEGGVDE